MGGFCTTGVEELPKYDETVTGTDIPSWVSAGGRTIFEQAAELAASEFPGFTGPRIATYDGSKLTPEEQAGFDLLTTGATTYQPFIDEAAEVSRSLGQGFDPTSREELIGDPSRQFTLEEAQPFIDMFQAAADPAVAETERILQKQLIDQRAKAGSSFGGSRQYLGEIETSSEAARRAGEIRAAAGAEGLRFGADRFEADRAQAERDRSARFAAEQAGRQAFETEEASRLRKAEQLQSFAPLVQGLQEQAASGMLSAGEARRRLDQMALDLAFADFVEQREFPFQMLNFAMGALKGVPYETTQYSLSQGQQFVQTPSVYGQTLGGLGALASAYYLSNRK